MEGEVKKAKRTKERKPKTAKGQGRPKKRNVQAVEQNFTPATPIEQLNPTLSSILPNGIIDWMLEDLEVPSLSETFPDTSQNQSQIDPAQTHKEPLKIDSHIDSSQINYSQINSSQPDYSKTYSSKINFSQIDSPQIDYSKIDYSKIDYSQIDYSQIKFSQIGSSQIGFQRAEIQRTDIIKIDIPLSDDINIVETIVKQPPVVIRSSEHSTEYPKQLPEVNDTVSSTQMIEPKLKEAQGIFKTCELLSSTHESSKLDNLDQLEGRVLEKLQSAQGSVSTIILAKSLGFQSKKEVNRVLFALQRKGLAIKTWAVPPAWVATKNS